MQVQKDAPVKLLLGTDTLPQLGFTLLEMDLGETGVDLLQKQTWKKQPRGGESTSIPDDCELTRHADQIPMQAELVKAQLAVPNTELSQAMAPQRQLQKFERAVPLQRGTPTEGATKGDQGCCVLTSSCKTTSPSLKSAPSKCRKVLGPRCCCF